MQTYGEYKPTPYDRAGIVLIDQRNWLVVPVGVNRDSEDLAQSNFYAALDRLDGESETVEVHRFGHWGCGWFEIIIVDPTSKHAAIAQSIEDDLENYPVLNEDDFCEREHESIMGVWSDMSMSDRIDTMHEYGASIFAARRDNPYDIETNAGDWPYILIQT